MIDLAKQPRLKKLSDDELLDYLRGVSEDLEASNERVAALYALRLRIYQEGRARDPKITHRALAEASGGMSDVTVIRALKKAEDDAARAATG